MNEKAKYYERRRQLNNKAKRLIRNCQEHNCPYLKRLGNGTYSNDKAEFYCAYCDITGHARIKEPENANPDNCTHWQDTIESNKTSLIMQDF